MGWRSDPPSKGIGVGREHHTSAFGLTINICGGGRNAPAAVASPAAGGLGLSAPRAPSLRQRNPQDTTTAGLGTAFLLCATCTTTVVVRRTYMMSHHVGHRSSGSAHMHRTHVSINGRVSSKLATDFERDIDDAGITGLRYETRGVVAWQLHPSIKA